MTYYGRWTYKFEEAERQGAAACLLIHEEDAAGYGWMVVAQSWGRGQLQLTTELGPSATSIQGWIQRGTAARVFQAAGLDMGAQIAAASKPGFKAVALDDTTFTGVLVNSVARGGSFNVVAKVKGSKRPDEAVLVMAHWDHLGRRPGAIRRTRSSMARWTTLGHGGVAGARPLGRLPGHAPRAHRSVRRDHRRGTGSAWFQALRVRAGDAPAQDRLRPEHRRGERARSMEDIVVVGYGASELDSDLRAMAAVQGRAVVPEPTPERGFYFRSDHFSLAKVGVPMLYTNPGTVSREHGAEWVTRKNRQYNKRNYHAVSDEYDPNWNLEGAAEDVRLFHGLVRLWANDPRMRQWSPGSEFRAARERSMRAGAAGK